MTAARLLPVLLLLAAACGEPLPEPPPRDTTPPVTSLSPTPGAHRGPVDLRLVTNEAAMLRWTLDGSDPAGANALTGPSPQSLRLEPPLQTTLRFFATDASGNVEAPQEARYELLEELRPASVSGKAFVHPSLRGPVQLRLLPASGGAAVAELELERSAEAIPWRLEGLPAGAYRVELSTPEASSISEELVLDPFDGTRARIDFVELALGTCAPGRGGVAGNIALSEADSERPLRILAFDAPLDPEAAALPGAVAETIAIRHEGGHLYALCDKAEANLWLFAALGDGPEVLVAHRDGPVTPNPALIRRDFTLGPDDGVSARLAGRLELSGALPGGHARVAIVRDGELLAARTFELDERVDRPLSIPGLPQGSLEARLFWNDADGLSAKRSEALQLSGSSRTWTDAFVLGAGRITGTVTWMRPLASPSIGVAAVIGVRRFAEAPITLADGASSAEFVLFGLLDGSYTVAAVPDMNQNGLYEDDLQHVEFGAPGDVVLEHAESSDRVEVVFD